jgi:hypothetical protein
MPAAHVFGFLCCCFKTILRSPSQDHVGASLSNGESHCSAKTSTTASDEKALAVQLEEIQYSHFFVLLTFSRLYFTAPKASPRTRWRCSDAKTMATGALARSVAAIT